MNGTTYGPDLSLTPFEEDLLRTALSSNPPASPQDQSKKTNGIARHWPRSKSPMANSADGYTSPTQEVPDSGTLGSFDESPILDQELEDGNFDWDNNGDPLFGDLPGTEYHEDGEHHDKRKASIDEDEEEEGSSKRREGGEKGAKKPGRKPLTGEPTTKRKAQNRAAQRAFRERKERHLKDLETKVEDLEKASEATNHENGRLRAQVDKLNTELKEYRKRISLNSTSANASPPLATSQSRNFNGSNDFQFAFPKFGDLPNSFISNGSMAKTSSPNGTGRRSASSSNPNLPGMTNATSPGSTNGRSPISPSGPFAAPMPNDPVNTNPDNNNLDFNTNNFEDLNGLFSPSILKTASRSNSIDYLSYNGGKSTSPSVKIGSTSSKNVHQAMPKIQQRNSSTSITASPVSSMSQNGLDSSCGTTPESSADSPDNRKPSEATLNTINEEAVMQNKPEAPLNVVKSPNTDINGIDWMAQQNGGQFDPVLFGDYRDSQDSILSNSFEDFFNDAFASPQDFTSPYNTGEIASQPQPQKKDLMHEIEVHQNGGPEDPIFGEAKSSETNQWLTEEVHGETSKQFLTCDKLWDRVQASEKVKSGATDMDDLCSQLKAKAKCSGSGAVIDQKDVDQILGPAPPEQQDFLKMFS